MTLIEEATVLLENMPQKKQLMAIDLLRLLSNDFSGAENKRMNQKNVPFKRTGKSDFNLPDDFDEHFDDLNEEIASLLCGENE